MMCVTFKRVLVHCLHNLPMAQKGLEWLERIRGNSEKVFFY